MDWFSWLSKTDLEPSLVTHYTLTFVRNELQQDDIAYFSHDLLQSMGISVAKHRLEILKLAMKEKGRGIHPMLWFIFAINHTKTFLAKHIEGLVHHENSALVPKSNYSWRWKVAMLQRNKKSRATMPQRQMMLTYEDSVAPSGQKMLMLTNGSPTMDCQSSCSYKKSKHWRITKDVLTNSRINSFSSTMVHEKLDSNDGKDRWSSVKEIKWDTMFQNLKPT